MKHLLIPYLVLTMIIVFSRNEILYGQSDPYGSLDSVTVQSKTINIGSKFSIGVTLKNDEAVAGFSIPLKYPQSLISFDSASYANSRARQWSVLRTTHDAQKATILLGGLAVGDPVLLPGDGIVAELFFHSSTGVTVGQTGSIDSGYIAPAGTFVISSFQSISISPGFVASGLTIGSKDVTLHFDAVSAKTVNEGDTLTFPVHAGDAGGTTISIVASMLPPNAKFNAQGNGTGIFSWAVPYAGPGSASSSPYRVIFTAANGISSAQLEVSVDVVNVDRSPEIIVDGSYTAASGDSVYIPLIATDPDFETISFSATGLPQNARLQTTNPGYISWGSQVADSGNYTIAVKATDAAGGSSSKQINLRLLPTVPVDLSINDEQAFSNEFVTLYVSMTNRVAVSGFHLLIEYDPTIITLLSAGRDSVRTKFWDTFTTSLSSDGKLFIDARTTSGNPNYSPLATGTGSVVELRFWTSPDPALSGMFSKVEFGFTDSNSTTENVVTQTDGTVITKGQINYNSGSVLIKRFSGLVGDINLNGIAFEIGDVVYFTNYFVDISHYPLNGERWANSDINQDGNPGTLADLVAMLRILSNGGSRKVNAGNSTLNAVYETDQLADGLTYRLTSPAGISAALYTFTVPPGSQARFESADALEGMEVRQYLEDSTLRVLIFNAAGGGWPVVSGDFFRVVGHGKVELISQECVDLNGNRVEVNPKTAASPLPSRYQLLQNFPNPFNPETVISFDLPQAGRVTLDVFDVLGRKVRELINDNLSAGRHQVTFGAADESGRQLSSGVYFYQLRCGSYTATQKMMLLK